MTTTTTTTTTTTSLAAILAHSARRWPDRTALVQGDRRVVGRPAAAAPWCPRRAGRRGRRGGPGAGPADRPARAARRAAGRPKGARLTHLNLTLNVLNSAFDSNRFERDDVVMGALPLFHVFGQQVAMNTTLRVGATLLLLPRFEPRACLELMSAEGATGFFGVPTMFVQLLQAGQAPDAPPVQPLRLCVSGGASLPVAVLEGFERRFGGHIHEGYGLSETSPTATVNQEVYGTRPGTVGHPVWGCEVEIADPAVRDAIWLLPEGQRGEVVVRGPVVFDGDEGDPAATAEAVVDGWFRTGDIGVKEDGLLRIVDRTTDLIIRGFNVYPREVEEVLGRVPGVAQVAVIGVPDPVYGEEVMAVVTAAEGVELDPQTVVDHGKEHLGGHTYPRRVEVVKALPMGPSMKIHKRELRQQFANPEQGDR